MTTRELVLARAPGRIVLLGDQVADGTGTVLSAAIDRQVSIELDRQSHWLELVSTADPDPAVIPTDVVNPSTGRPVWARYFAAAVAVLQPEVGGTGFVTSDIPIGLGMGSSTALTVAACLAVGFQGAPEDLALTAHQAEMLATGTPPLIADGLTVTGGVADHLLVVDGLTMERQALPLPEGVVLLVAPTGEQQDLVAATYSVRRSQCEEAAELIGPLRTVTAADVESIHDDTLRRRARHVHAEQGRVRAAAAALEVADLRGLGVIMAESHAGMRDDFEVVSGTVDGLVERLSSTPGVYGARVSGALGGCVVAVAEEDADVDLPMLFPLRPAGPASVGPARG